MMNFNNYSPLKDMPVCLPEALAYYHKVAEQERTKAARGYRRFFNDAARTDDALNHNKNQGKTRATLAGLGHLVGGVLDLAAYRLTSGQRTRAEAALREDRLHDLVDPMVKLNVIRAIALDAENRGIDFNDLPCIQSGDFKRVLAYAAARAQHLGVANTDTPQPK